MCEPPAVQRIDFYQGIDVPLATFLAATGPNLEAPKRCAHPGCGGRSSCCSSSLCWHHLCPQAQPQPPDHRGKLTALVTEAILLGLRELGPQGCHLCQYCSHAQNLYNQRAEAQKDQQQNVML